MNLNNLLKQAQSMQKTMEAIQKNFAVTNVTETDNTNNISVTMNLKHDLIDFKINKSSILDDVELLEDLIIVAFKKTKTKVDQMIDEEYKKNGIPSGMDKFYTALIAL